MSCTLGFVRFARNSTMAHVIPELPPTVINPYAAMGATPLNAATAIHPRYMRGSGVPLSGWLTLGGLFLAYLSYAAGTAMAPTPKQRRMWGLMAIPLGMFMGPFGLGLMGLASVKRVDKMLT
jgi:hypothetical protein